jgi:hypothetical protein
MPERERIMKQLKTNKKWLLIIAVVLLAAASAAVYENRSIC